MGDRANIHTYSDGKDSGVWFYTHNGGIASTTAAVRAALKKATDRWEDPSYMNRVIFCELVKNDVDGTMGYGISDHMNDNDTANPIVEVDYDSGKVTVGTARYTFKQFAGLK